MKRIDIAYGGQAYSVGNIDIAQLREQILSATKDGEPMWLEVNVGEGQPRPTFLLISRGVDIALTPVPGDDAHP